MRFQLMTCCCCIPIKRAIFYIIYIDMAHLLYAIILLVVLIMQTMATLGDYVFNTTTLLSNIFLNYYACKALNPDNNQKKYKKYLFAKIIFVLIVIGKLIFLPRFNCFSNSTLENCFFEHIGLLFFIETFWTILDIYFLIILGFFFKKFSQGFSIHIEGNHVFTTEVTNFGTDYSNLKFAIVLEVQGRLIRNSLFFDQKLYRRRKKQELKKNFLKIYPSPLIAKKAYERVEIRDLSAIMAKKLNICKEF